MEYPANAETWSERTLTEHKEIEPLEGEVCPQFIRCGKPGCRCQYDKPHGPYHYRIWREGTRVRKVYVKATEVEAVRAACVLGFLLHLACFDNLDVAAGNSHDRAVRKLCFQHPHRRPGADHGELRRQAEYGC